MSQMKWLKGEFKKYIISKEKLVFSTKEDNHVQVGTTKKEVTEP